MTPGSMARFLKALYAEAGISGASSHSGRRTLITRLAERGIDLKSIAEIAGHTSIRTTAMYVEANPKRLARILVLMAEFGKPGEPEQYIPKISQETLAEMIGTTRSRVSFFMNRFRKLGFIEYNGRIKVHKSLLKMVLHEEFTERHPERSPASATARTRSKPARRA